MHRPIRTIISGIALLLLIYMSSTVQAADLSSTNFKIRDPILGTGGGYSSSGTFKLNSGGNTLLSGIGSSATYIGRYGFFYYPYVKQGTFTATSTGAGVNLSWTATTTAQGFTVGGYKVGVATVSGGPYDYVDVGNVTSYSYPSLMNGTYYFVLVTYDALGNTIATSAEENAVVVQSVTFSLTAN